MHKTNTVKVWDSAVRVFHWSLVLFFVIAYFTGEDESEWHIYTGYAVLALISFRVLWGFIGTRYARFTQFIYSPSTVLSYTKSLLARNPKRYLGHNPLGGYMVIALLVTLFAVTLSGLKLYAIEENAGPFSITMPMASGSYAPAKYVPAEDDEELWEEIHEVSVNLMLLLIFLHVSGVIISGRLHKENLAKAMITGNKPEQ